MTSAQAGAGTQAPPYAQQYFYAYDNASNRTGVQTALTQTVRLAGTTSIGKSVTITVNNAGLSGGTKSDSYTMAPGDSLTAVASKLAGNLTADASLQAIGVSAFASGTTITLRSASQNLSTYSASTTDTSLTLTLGVKNNGLQNAVIGGSPTTSDVLKITVYDAGLTGGNEPVTYMVQSGDTLTSIASNLAAKINSDSHLSGIGCTATAASTTVNIKSTSSNLTTYTQSVSGSGTETITLSLNMNVPQTMLVGGTVTVGNTLTVVAYDSGLTGGQEPVSYMVQSGDTLTSIASSIASKINADTNLQGIGVSASSSSTVITINSASPNVTTWTGGVSSSATETLTVGLPANGTTTAAIGGTAHSTDVLTLTVYDAGLTGGSEPVSYTVSSTDTLATIANALKNAINSDSHLSGIGVTASYTSPTTVINISSTSVNNTSYTQSVSSGSTETIALSLGTAATQYLYNNANELIAYEAGGPIRYEGATNKAVQSASVATDVVTITGAAPNATTYSESTNVGATETITFGTNTNGNVAATIGGMTITMGDVLTIDVDNASLANGVEPVMYSVPSGATLTSIATGIAAAINADVNLPAIGVSATSSGPVVNIAVARPTYTASTGGGTETITLGINNYGSTTATIGGTVTSGNTLTITTHYPSLSSGQEPVQYTVLSTDTLATIAAALAALINADTHLQGIGVTGAASSNATLNWSENFTANAPIGAGTNVTTTSATDGGSNTKTNTYQVSTNSASSTSLTFDSNGNMTSDGTNAYTWDAESRLIQITYPGTGNNSQFTYDGLGHTVRIVEIRGGTTTSTKQFIWCDEQMSEARDASSNLVNQYFAYGQTISGSNYYYVLDQNGSIIALMDSSGNVVSTYSYDAYGRVAQTQGSVASDFQYAGYYFHAPSALSLAVYRAYSASLGRWISRDPIGETSGLNFYRYVKNEPINATDPSGLWPRFLPGRGTAEKELPDRLKKWCPCLTPDEISKLTKDILDHFDLGDIGIGKRLRGIGNINDLTPPELSRLTKFLDGIPDSSGKTKLLGCVSAASK